MDKTQSTNIPSIEAKTSGLAVASLVLGIFGFCTFGITGIIGLVLGIVGLCVISRSSGRLKGNGLAIAGIVVSAVSLFMLFITFLIALLVPALTHAKHQARSVVSMNNTRQLCLAMHLYCEDNDDKFPAPDSWSALLSDYIKNERILASPFDPDAGPSYAMNDQLNGLKRSDIRNPAKTVLLFEAKFGSSPAGGLDLLPEVPGEKKGYVIGFVDGHIEFVQPDEVEQLIWSP